MATYDNKAIKGSQLERLTTAVLEKVVEKQDIINAAYDPTNHRLKLNNVTIRIPNP